MARITVEDCLEHVENRFALVLLATKRARQLANGKEPLIDRGNDKPTVLALREIAKGLISEEMLAKVDRVEEEEVLEMPAGGDAVTSPIMPMPIPPAKPSL